MWILKLRKLLKPSKSLTYEICRTLLVGSATVDAAVLFNQAHGVANDSTEFTLSIHALASSTENTHESLASSKSTILSDLSPQSWEEVKSEIVLPEKTDFLVLAFSAKKIGPDALVADASHHYADNLNINLSSSHLELEP